MSHIFISYSTKDSAYARQIATALRDKGFNVWIDERRLRSSEDWWRSIVLSIRSCAAFIVIMSSASDTSRWVQREVTLADKYEKPIFPLLLEGTTDTPNWEIFVRTQYEDVRNRQMPTELFYTSLESHAVRQPVKGHNLTREDVQATTPDEDVIAQDMLEPPPPELEPEDIVSKEDVQTTALEEEIIVVDVLESLAPEFDSEIEDTPSKEDVQVTIPEEEDVLQAPQSEFEPETEDISQLKISVKPLVDDVKITTPDEALEPLRYIEQEPRSATPLLKRFIAPASVIILFILAYFLFNVLGLTSIIPFMKPPLAYRVELIPQTPMDSEQSSELIDILDLRMRLAGIDNRDIREASGHFLVEFSEVDDVSSFLSYLSAPGMIEFVDFSGLRTQSLNYIDQRILTTDSIERGSEDAGTSQSLLNPFTGGAFETGLTGDCFASSAAQSIETLGWMINFVIESSCREQFGEFTGQLIGQPMAIVLDGVVLSAPVVNSQLTTGGVISGAFTEEEAKQLAWQLQSPLSVSLEVGNLETLD